MMFVAVFTVYGGLFSFGFWIYGNIIPAIIATTISVSGVAILFKLLGKLKFS